jgi:hypothetical protein
MGVVNLKRPLPLGVSINYCPHKDEKSTAFDIKPQRRHINEKMVCFIEKNTEKTRCKGMIKGEKMLKVDNKQKNLHSKEQKKKLKKDRIKETKEAILIH